MKILSVTRAGIFVIIDERIRDYGRCIVIVTTQEVTREKYLNT